MTTHDTAKLTLAQAELERLNAALEDRYIGRRARSWQEEVTP